MVFTFFLGVVCLTESSYSPIYRYPINHTHVFGLYAGVVTGVPFSGKKRVRKPYIVYIPVHTHWLSRSLVQCNEAFCLFFSLNSCPPNFPPHLTPPHHLDLLGPALVSGQRSSLFDSS